MIAMKFYGGARGDKTDKQLDFGSDPHNHADCPIRNLAFTQHIMSWFWWHFHNSSAMLQGTID